MDVHAKVVGEWTKRMVNSVGRMDVGGKTCVRMDNKELRHGTGDRADGADGADGDKWGEDGGERGARGGGPGGG